MSASRFLAAALLPVALLASGCATLMVGQKVIGKQDPAMLDVCFIGADERAVTRNGIQRMMVLAANKDERFPVYFRSATFSKSLDDVDSCDVAIKTEGRNMAFSRRPAELYSARSRKLLARVDGHIDNGPNGIVWIAADKLKKGSALYEQVISEAGPARKIAIAATVPAVSAPASVAPAPSAVSKEELRQMMAEAVKAAKDEAPAAPQAPSSDVDAPRYKSAEDPERYAVVVGVEKYNGLPDASYAERDAKAVYAHLLALGFPARNIALVTGAQATRTALVKNLEAWLPQNAGEGSTVLFYYSGHGAPDPAGGQAYLVPADGDPQYLQETAYPVKRVYEKLGALKARRVLVAMDSCFSGAGGRSVLAKGTRPLVGVIDLGAAGGKVASLTASASTQISGALDEQAHGLFTYYLLKGLNGEARDGSGAVTVKSLHSYLTPKVQDAAKRANRDQVPQLISGDGDFRLR